MFATRRIRVAAMVLALALAGMVVGRPVYAGARGPAYIHPGDTVTVTEGARLMVGRETLSTLARGLHLKVRRVQQGWLSTTVQVRGKPVNGWVRVDQVTKGELGRAPTAHRSATHRNFSYEFGSQPVHRGYRSYGRQVPNYLRMKTDQHKYDE